MKVGLIGLGRMGEGMSRRMLKAGIEVWGYRRNYAKAQEAFEAGYVSGVATSLESLVQVVKHGASVYGEKSGETVYTCLLYTSPSPRDLSTSRMPSSA